MKIRALGLSLLLLIALAFSSVLSAQDLDLDPCFGLAAADCEVINQASVNALPTENYTISMSIDFAFAGTSFDPEVPAAAVNFNMAGDVNIVMVDDSSFTPNVSGLFTINANSENLGQLAALAGGAAPGGAEPTLDPVENMMIEFRIVDDIFYLANPDDNSEWVSLDLIAVLDDPAFGENLPLNPNALGEDADALLAGIDPEALLSALNGLINLPGLFSYTRAGDDFTWVMDLSALSQLLEEENADTLTALGDAFAGVTGDEGGAAAFDPTALVSLGVGFIGPDSQITVTQGVDTAAQFVDDLGFDMVLDLALLGTASLDVDFGVGNFDGVTASVAPENAEAIDPAELSQVLGGLGLGG